MNVPDRTEEKHPLILDFRPIRRRPESERVIRQLINKEKATRLQSAATELGKFSVQIIAEAGEPYTVLRNTAQGIDTISAVMEVPEDKVIISMTNTANVHAPTDMTELWQSLRQ